MRSAAHVVEPLLSRSAASPAKTVVLGAILVVHDLCLGVISELEAGRAANAMRLARHAFEQRIQLEYVLGDPVPRMRQLAADEIGRQLEIARSINRLKRIPRPKLERFLAIEKDASERDQRFTKAGKSARASDRGSLPNMREMAKAAGLGEDYNLFYPGASWYSHPGIGTSEGFLTLTDRGEIRGVPAFNPHMPDQAASLALEQLVLIAERANWSLGPVGGIGDALRVVREEATRRAALRPAPGAPLRQIFPVETDGPPR